LLKFHEEILNDIVIVCQSADCSMHYKITEMFLCWRGLFLHITAGPSLGGWHLGTVPRAPRYVGDRRNGR